MAISCPTCGTPASFSATVRQAGQLVRCQRCGTAWFPRSRPDDPYARHGSLPEWSDVSDAIVIDDATSPNLTRPALPALPALSLSRQPLAAASSTARLHRLLRLGAIAVAATVAVAALKTPILAALPQPGAPVAAHTGLPSR